MCGNKDCCCVIMRSEDTSILKFNQHYQTDKAPATIYADLECFTKKKMDVKIIQ